MIPDTRTHTYLHKGSHSRGQAIGIGDCLRLTLSRHITVLAPGSNLSPQLSKETKRNEETGEALEIVEADVDSRLSSRRPFAGLIKREDYLHELKIDRHANVQRVAFKNNNFLAELFRKTL